MKKPRQQTDTAAAATILLDTAERLFSELGFFGVSVRDIIKDADQTLGSVNYHFGTKEGLFVAVVSRRATELNDERLKMLGAIDLGLDTSKQLGCVVRAFVAPLLKRVNGAENDGWRCYFRLIAQVSSAKIWAAKVVSPEFDATGQVFISRFKHMFPDTSERKIQLCYQFMLGNMLYTFSENGRLDLLSNQTVHSSELEAIIEDFVVFTIHGIRGLALE